jgi:hypothetical protein
VSVAEAEQSARGCDREDERAPDNELAAINVSPGGSWRDRGVNARFAWGEADDPEERPQLHLEPKGPCESGFHVDVPIDSTSCRIADSEPIVDQARPPADTRRSKAGRAKIDHLDCQCVAWLGSVNSDRAKKGMSSVALGVALDVGVIPRSDQRSGSDEVARIGLEGRR